MPTKRSYELVGFQNCIKPVMKWVPTVLILLLGICVQAIRGPAQFQNPQPSSQGKPTSFYLEFAVVDFDIIEFEKNTIFKSKAPLKLSTENSALKAIASTPLASENCSGPITEMIDKSIPEVSALLSAKQEQLREKFPRVSFDVKFNINIYKSTKDENPNANTCQLEVALVADEAKGAWASLPLVIYDLKNGSVTTHPQLQDLSVPVESSTEFLLASLERFHVPAIFKVLQFSQVSSLEQKTSDPHELEQLSF